MLTPSETRAPEARASKPWRLYDVTVRWGDTQTHTETVCAPSPAAARYRRFLSAKDAFSDLSFQRFISMATVRPASATMDPNAYDYVRRAYGLNVKIGDRIEIQNECKRINGRQGVVVEPNGHAHYVHVFLDGQDFRSLLHPDSVRPLPASLESQKEGAAL